MLSQLSAQLNPAKATGYDTIPPKVLKIAAPVVANPTALIINNSIRTAKFPSDCKHAEIGPIHKKDELLLNTNYRAVCILTGISKIEKNMNIQMHPFQIEVPLTSAYRKGYSYQYSLMKLM